MPAKLTDLIRTLNLTFGPFNLEPRWPSQSSVRRLPRAIVMTDNKRMPDPAAVLDALPPGIAMVFRHYGDPNRDIQAQKVVDRAHRLGIQVLVAGDAQLARRVGADGVHLPSHLLHRRVISFLAARRTGWLVTAAVHNQRELTWATNAQVDAVMASPVFATTTRVQRRTLGVIGIRRITNIAPMPVFALGGLSATLLPRLRTCGTIGFAGVEEFLRQR